MRIGIITFGCKRKWFERINPFSRKILYKLEVLDKFEIISVKLFEGKNNKKLFKVRNKLEKMCDVVLCENSFNTKMHKTFFYETAFHIYKNSVRENDIKPHKQKLLIVDSELSVINKKRLETICFWCSECFICTNDIQKANCLCSYMSDECGAAFSCINYKYGISGFDVVFELDKFSVKICKNIHINKFDFGLSEISERFKIPQLVLAAELYGAGLNPVFVKTEGRCALFTFTNKNGVDD